MNENGSTSAGSSRADDSSRPLALRGVAESGVEGIGRERRAITHTRATVSPTARRLTGSEERGAGEVAGLEQLDVRRADRRVRRGSARCRSAPRSRAASRRDGKHHAAGLQHRRPGARRSRRASPGSARRRCCRDRQPRGSRRRGAAPRGRRSSARTCPGTAAMPSGVSNRNTSAPPSPRGL